MKRMLLFFVLTLINFCNGQTIRFTDNSITVEKWNDTMLIVPIETIVSNSGATNVVGNVITSVSNINMGVANFAITTIKDDIQAFNLDRGKEAKKTSYLVIPSSINITGNTQIRVDATIGGGVATSLTVTLIPAKDLVYTLHDYLQRDDLNLSRITKVESTNNVLSIYGYHNSNNRTITKRQVALKRGEVYSVSNYSGFVNFYKPKTSITTVPFKVRPKQNSFESVASSGLTNLGFNLDFFGWKKDRYFSSGTKSQHRVGFGVWIAPTVEELDSIHMERPDILGKDEKSKQLFISTGLTLSYTYNDISFIFVPIGWDFGTSSIGKDWIYNNKRWWGFGIAVSPKIFESIFK